MHSDTVASLPIGGSICSFAPIYDEVKKYKGALVSWDIATKRIENEKKVAMIQSMVEAAPVNILMADRDLKLTFMNPASIRTLRTIEKLLPKPVDQLMGQSIDTVIKQLARNFAWSANNCHKNVRNGCIYQRNRSVTF